MPTLQQGWSCDEILLEWWLTSIKALLAVFKSRISDPRGGDTSIDRCEVSVEDKPNKVQCRLVVKMVCRHGKFIQLAVKIV
jgi:hypothetical protein